MINSAKQQPMTIGKFAAIILTPKDANEHQRSRSLISYVKRLIEQYRLKSTDVDVDDVLSEAFTRAIKKYENELIDFPNALMRTFCFHIIREMKRRQTKYDLSKDGCLEEVENPAKDSSFTDSLDFHKIEKLELFLKTLPNKDRKIIDLWSKNWSDRDIARELTSSGDPISTPSVKKRRQRLIQRLRKKVNS